MNSRFYGAMNQVRPPAHYVARGQVRKGPGPQDPERTNKAQRGTVFNVERPSVPQSRLISDVAQQILHQQAIRGPARNEIQTPDNMSILANQRGYIPPMPDNFADIRNMQRQDPRAFNYMTLANSFPGQFRSISPAGAGFAVQPGTGYVTTPGGLAAVPGVGDPNIARRANQYSMGTMPQRMRWAMGGTGPTLADVNYGGGR